MKLKNIIPLIVMLLSSLMLSAQSINDLCDTIQDNNITPPHSFETSADSLAKNWYYQQYVTLSAPKETEITARTIAETPSDELYIQRLQYLQNEGGFTIEMPYNSVVKSYIEMYTSKQRKALVEKMLGMWLYYEPIFEVALAKEGIPLELKYLPIIESALNPNAVSPAGAAGLWQFILSTGRGMGLEINSLVDERRDTYKASQKAAEFLKQLYNTYGDWSLVIAAYNCGPGNVNKAIRRAGGGKKDFWEIYNFLPKGTRGYVPAFIAAAYVMNFHNEHGISTSLAKKPLVTDTVQVKRRINFKQIADVIDIDVNAIEALNPQYLKNTIPAGPTKPYTLILPCKYCYMYVMSEDIIGTKDAEKYRPRERAEPGVSRSEQKKDVAAAVAQDTQTTSVDKKAEPTAKQSQKTVVPKEHTKVKMGFLILESNPSGAEVFITQNGEKRYEGNTPFQKKVPYGNYSYRIKKQHYHDEKGVVVLDSIRVIKKVELRPTFGSLKVTTNPSGAKVTLESDGRSFTSPCEIENIPSGEHYVSIVSPRYSSLRKKVLIQDGKTTPLNTTLDARFAQVTINTLPNAKIVINGEQRGVGSFVGELDEGTYDVEVSLAQHRNVTRQIKVVAKQSQSITINPTPIYGSLDVITTPMYAEIVINGKNYGTTPTTIENLLVGDYEVRLSKDGCVPQSRKVTISENNLSTLEVELPQSREMTIRSDGNGFRLAIRSNTFNSSSNSYSYNNTKTDDTPSYTYKKKKKKSKKSTYTPQNNYTAQTYTKQATTTTPSSKSKKATADKKSSKSKDSKKTTSKSSTKSKDSKKATTSTKSSKDSKKSTASKSKAKDSKKSTSSSKSSSSKKSSNSPKILYSSSSNNFITTVNGVSFKMIKVKGGTFQMGSNDSEAYGDEKPVHNVTLSDYYIGETEVTQELWEAVMGSNPSGFKGSKRPVERVSWNDCQKFIKKLNQLTGKNFRLPTEAEWEYAARGGNKSRGYKYSGSNTIGDVAWYCDNADYVGKTSPDYGTHTVGTKSPNELGLYDMSGNVWEWCVDWCGDYSSSSQTNPTGPTSGSVRVLRGGSWRNYARGCRVASRNYVIPGGRSDIGGLRLALRL